MDRNSLPKKQKVIPQIRRNIENKPRLGKGRAGIKCKNPQLSKNINASTDKSHEIPKIPMAQI